MIPYSGKSDRKSGVTAYEIGSDLLLSNFIPHNINIHIKVVGK